MFFVLLISSLIFCYLPCLQYVNPRQLICHLVRQILDFWNRFPSAWHKFLLNGHEVYVLYAFVCARQALNYWQPVLNLCHKRPFVHPLIVNRKKKHIHITRMKYNRNGIFAKKLYIINRIHPNLREQHFLESPPPVLNCLTRSFC